MANIRVFDQFHRAGATAGVGRRTFIARRGGRVAAAGAQQALPVLGLLMAIPA
jgi:hypothetical protein